MPEEKEERNLEPGYIEIIQALENLGFEIIEIKNDYNVGRSFPYINIKIRRIGAR